MTESFAFGFVTYGASLGSSAGCIFPVVTERFAFSCATYGASLGGGAVCSYPRVTLSGNNCLCNKNFITNRAVFAFGKTGVCAISSNSFINYFGVTESVNGFLCNENLVTNGAVFTFGFTFGGAGCSNCCVNHFGMTLSGNNCLCNDYFATNRAVLAFGFTFGGAGCSNGRVNYFGVTLSGNNCLCNDYFATNRAVLAFGFTFGGAGCSNGRVNYFGVTEGFILFVGGVVATRASYVCIPTNFGTSGSFCINLLEVVTKRFPFGYVTYGAGLGGGAVCSYPSVLVVSKRRNETIRYGSFNSTVYVGVNLATVRDRASVIFLIARSRASCIGCRCLCKDVRTNLGKSYIDNDGIAGIVLSQNVVAFNHRLHMVRNQNVISGFGSICTYS